MFRKAEKKIKELRQKMAQAGQTLQFIESIADLLETKRQEAEDAFFSSEISILKEAKIQIARIDLLPEDQITDEIRRFRAKLENILSE